MGKDSNLVLVILVASFWYLVNFYARVIKLGFIGGPRLITAYKAEEFKKEARRTRESFPITENQIMAGIEKLIKEIHCPNDWLCSKKGFFELSIPEDEIKRIDRVRADMRRNTDQWLQKSAEFETSRSERKRTFVSRFIAFLME